MSSFFVGSETVDQAFDSHLPLLPVRRKKVTSVAEENASVSHESLLGPKRPLEAAPNRTPPPTVKGGGAWMPGGEFEEDRRVKGER